MICIVCGLSEPCGLHCPGSDGQPDPTAPLVCMMENSFTWSIVPWSPPDPDRKSARRMEPARRKPPASVSRLDTEAMADEARIVELMSQIDYLKNENAFSDTRRLDWLEANSPNVNGLCLESEAGRLQVWIHGKLLGQGSTLRQAIDAAMRRENENGKV